MKTTFLALAFGFIGGAALSYSQTAKHYEAKARELVESAAMAEQIRADKSKEQVDELYEKYQNALNVEPVTVDRVVYVKGKCPVQADTSTGLDHGADAFRFEINPGTVRSVERVAIKHEQNYKQCAAQLRAAQALLSD